MSIRRVPWPASGAVPVIMLRGAHWRHNTHRGGWQAKRRSTWQLGAVVPLPIVIGSIGYLVVCEK
jgi:hypothetical protein